jgi:hypothetical protein
MAKQLKDHFKLIACFVVLGAIGAPQIVGFTGVDIDGNTALFADHVNGRVRQATALIDIAAKELTRGRGVPRRISQQSGHSHSPRMLTQSSRQSTTSGSTVLSAVYRVY